MKYWQGKGARGTSKQIMKFKTFSPTKELFKLSDKTITFILCRVAEVV